jgi:hypothetical protein
VAVTPPTVYLHIGTPKSGTTYLQSRMARNQRRAASQGLLWPGPGWSAHVQAARELRRLRPGEVLAAHGPWSELAKRVTSWSGESALISMEWLIASTPEQIAAALDSLQPCRVEVIVTARDLLRTFVAQWQEMTKNYRPWGWEQFLAEVRDEDTIGRSREAFWSQQDVPVVLRRWAEQIPRDRIHLITVPPPGADPELLWSRFCGVLGIDGTRFGPPRYDNASLGVVSSILMQRLNVAALAQGVPHDVYKSVIHREVGRRILADRREVEGPIAVSDDMDAWIRRRSEQMLADIRAVGVDIVGDMDELVPARPLKGRQPNDVTDTELLDACAETLVRLGVRQHEEIALLRAENASLKRRLRPPESRAGPGMDVLRRSDGSVRRALRRVRRRLTQPWRSAT